MKDINPIRLIDVRPMEGEGLAIEGDGIYMSTEIFSEEGSGLFIEGGGYA